MDTIEPLMRKREEERRQRRTAALSDDIQADGGMWKVEPSPAACPTCLELSRKIYAEKPNPPHPNCKCRISKREEEEDTSQKKPRYYVIGRRPLDGLGSVSTTKLDWIKKWDKELSPSGKGSLPTLLPEHRHFFDSEGNNFGFFGDSKIRPDENENLHLYTYGNIKYNAEIIDMAVKEYEHMHDKFKKHIKELSKTTKDTIINQVHSDIDAWKYNLFLNNCQDYVGAVLFLARDISEQQGIPLIIN